MNSLPSHFWDHFIQNKCNHTQNGIFRSWDTGTQRVNTSEWGGTLVTDWYPFWITNTRRSRTNYSFPTFLFMDSFSSPKRCNMCVKRELKAVGNFSCRELQRLPKQMFNIKHGHLAPWLKPEHSLLKMLWSTRAIWSPCLLLWHQIVSSRGFIQFINMKGFFDLVCLFRISRWH